MNIGFCIAEGFCNAEINDMNYVLCWTSSEQDVIRFDITVDKMSRVDEFKKIYLSNK